MTDQMRLILIIALVVVALILVLIIVLNTRKSNLKKDVDELQVRYNTIKTIPIAFKINKAQAIAKRNAQTADKVKVYYDKYEEAQKNIDQFSDFLENIEDEFATKNYSEVRELLISAKQKAEECEKEINEIDKFLEEFSEEETILRENSAKLKEKFLKLKYYTNNSASALSIALPGIEKKIEIVEELFSQSEEFIFTNDYESAKGALDRINKNILDIEKSLLALPELVADCKGVIPALFDEVNRQYALSRQRGVYTDHLKIDEELKNIDQALNEDLKVISVGDLGNVKEHNKAYKEKLNTLLSSLREENKNFQELKAKSDEVVSAIQETKGLHNYVSKSYEIEKERFGLEDMDAYIKDSEKAINDYQASYIALNGNITDNSKAASELMSEANALLNEIKQTKTELGKYKATFDKNTTDESRAKSQLIKFTAVLNEVEVKVSEYHLPAIADRYKDDLLEGRNRIGKIKELLNEIPLNLPLLNQTLDETIQFIDRFYNDANNIVGMAIMVENAIVFGNKYRSSHPEVERDLSRAELSYLNGEYTKALTMAIACMEKLFPNRKGSNYLENA